MLTILLSVLFLIHSIIFRDYVKSDNQGGKAKVVIADVDTSNGVIHAIDNVVIPE